MDNNQTPKVIDDTGERMLPPEKGEVSVVWSRHNFAYEFSRQFISKKDVLDVGCGTGYGCHLLAKEANSVYGIDYHQDAIDYCQKHFSAANLTF